MKFAELEILIVSDVLFHYVSSDEVVLFPVLFSFSDRSGSVWQRSSEPLGIVIDQTRLEGTATHALSADQHKGFAFEWRRPTDFFIEKQFGLIELGVGLKSEQFT